MKKTLVFLIVIFTLLFGSIAQAQTGKNDFTQAFSTANGTYYVDNLSIGFYQDKDFFAVDFIKINPQTRIAELSTLVCNSTDRSYKISHQAYLSSPNAILQLITEKKPWALPGTNLDNDLLITYVLHTIRYPQTLPAIEQVKILGPSKNYDSDIKN